MKFIQYVEKLETIKYLATHKKTGKPAMLAKKLDVSERTVQRMIQQLRDYGHSIRFNRLRCTYELKINTDLIQSNK